MSATFIACLLLFGTAFHFLIVAPATQILARVQLDLATRHIQSEAERTFRRMETQLRTARSWGQAERLKFDDTAGFNALLVPLLAGDAQISAIHLADTDGREVMLMRDTDGWRNRVTQPGTQDKGNRWLHWSTAGTLLDDNWKNGHYDPRSRPWFEAALKTASDDALAWTAPYRLLTTGDGGITVSTRWTGPNGKTRILAFDVLLTDLSRLTVDTPVGERGGSTVLTDTGEVVGVPRYPRFANLSDRRDAVLQPATALNVDFLTHGYARWLDSGRHGENTLKYENENETWLAQFVPLQLGEQQWWVGGFAREADFIPARLRDVAPALALLIVLSAAAAAHLAHRVSRRIETALASIVERSERIGRLDLSPNEALNAPWQEIAELAESQERMRIHLRDATEGLAQSRAELEKRVIDRTHQLADTSKAVADQLLFIQVLLDALPNPVFYKGPDARFLGCNRAYEEAFGTTRGFLIGKTVLDLPYLPSSERIAFHDEDQHIIASAGSLHREERIPFADGKQHDTLYWVTGFRLASGEPGGLLGVLVDISAQKEAERIVRAAEERSRQMLESSPIAVVINRPDGAPLFANSRALMLTGTDMATFMQQPVTRWFRDPTAAENAIATLRDGRPVRDVEIEFQNIDGKSCWTLMTTEQIEVRGTPALISWCYDITARKHAEQELRKLSLAVEQSPSMLVITTPGGAIQYANPRFRQVTGFSADELTGTLPDLVDAAGLPFEFHAEQWHELKTQGLWRRECQLRRHSGEPLWVGISVSGLAEDSGEITHCIWVLEDLSLYRQAVDTLREAKRLAEEAAESKARFLANMSHEIRTPMNAIIGLANLSLGTELPPRQHDYLTKIHNAGTSLLGVVNDILDFSKIEAGKLNLEQTSFALDGVLDNVFTFVAQKAQEKGLELILQVAPNVPQDLLGDPLRLGQILTNLLGNAVKFTDRGEVQLRVDTVAHDSRHVQLRFEVCDTGIGMNAEQLGRLFEAFAQADDSMTRRFGGTGLGLSISRHLVELMGGHIEVSSLPGEGSHFSFSIRFELAEQRTPKALPGMLEGLRVLVVDDHPVARMVLLELLRNFPFRSEAVESAAEAVAAVRRADSGDRFGLVLMDLRMPGQNGIEATRRIKQDRSLASPPTVILLTAFGDDNTATEAADAGADAYLHKPATASTLLDTIVGAFGVGAGPQILPDHHAANAAHQLAGLRILVVEDNDINQQIARGLLEKLGACVSVVDNGRIAVETVLDAGPDAFDLVLMDLQMPEMDGLEATRRIRLDARMASLPIVAMTAHAMADQRQRCVDAGMNDHVAKPIVLERLLDTIRRQTRATAGKPYAPQLPAPSPATTGLPELPGLNVVAALRRVGNEPATYLSFLRHFVSTQTDCPQRIDAALAAGHLAEAERLAHTLRGTAANLGAGALQEAAAQLEMALRKGTNPNAAQQNLAAELEALRQMLENALPSPGQADHNAPRLGEAELERAINTLIQLIESADGDAPARFRQIRPDLITRIGREKTTEIADALQHYDYDQALACLRPAAQKA
ncbi:response regulator [Zoogloea sp.]|uniref:response regulator n=1 Tax=Zoogloea sp. TaxID=49181 RepID=UPI00258F36BA|nr:response regulator [Zoogloea sp.]MDD2667394.1 response regulator [Zoogloea sp.]